MEKVKNLDYNKLGEELFSGFKTEDKLINDAKINFFATMYILVSRIEDIVLWQVREGKKVIEIEFTREYNEWYNEENFEDIIKIVIAGLKSKGYEVESYPCKIKDAKEVTLFINLKYDIFDFDITDSKNSENIDDRIGELLSTKFNEFNLPKIKV